MDLLGEADDGTLLHIELQSDNDLSMSFRMLEYGVKVARKCGRYPDRQVVLYVGGERMRMETEYRANALWTFRCEIVDIRDLDGQRLLQSAGIEDNVLAILARLSDYREALHQIVSRVVGLTRRRGAPS